jgi:hypothetical protein
VFYNFAHKDPELVQAQVNHLTEKIRKHIADGDERKLREYILRSFDSWNPAVALVHPGILAIAEGMKVLRDKYGYKLRPLVDGNLEFHSGRNTLISTRFAGKDIEMYPEVAKNLGFHIKHAPRHLMSEDEE